MASTSTPRRRSVVAVGLVVLAMLTACSSSSDSNASSARSTTTATSSTTTTIAPQTPSTVPTPAGATVTQPAQPTSGPGSSALTHHDWRVSSGGAGANAWYVFEPTAPRPKAAPLAIVMHGYYEYAGYDQMYELIRHTVLGGSVVIYPRWQTGEVTPCPGPFDLEPCMKSSLAGIRGALAYLAADPSRVQPQLDRTSYFGFSFGGILTANLTNRWKDLDLPKPRAIFLDDPHDSGLDGKAEPSLDDSLHGIPSTVLIECHDGAQGVLAEDPTGACNAVFPKLDHISDTNKAIVLTEPDDHGRPKLSSAHGVCSAPEGKADAYDWNFCWKVWDDLRTAALDGARPDASIGDTTAHTSNGDWSDGTPIASLKVQHEAPIHP